MLRTEHRDWIAARLAALGHIGIEAEILDMVARAEEREEDLEYRLEDARDTILELKNRR